MVQQRQEGGVKPTYTRPTPEEWAAGAKVKLTRPGWTNSQWSVHGLHYAIVFNEDDEALVLKSHYEMWVAQVARSSGVLAEDVPARKKTAKKKESKKWVSLPAPRTAHTSRTTSWATHP
jgi:hypothetical protein